jgi:uncharacterized protein YjiK
MVTKWDKIFFGITAIFLIALFVFWKDVKSVLINNTVAVQQTSKEDKQGKKKKKNKENDQDITSKDNNFDSKISIIKKWDLPVILKEVSGISYIEDNRFACVQDELGKIFIYNTANNNIEKEIPFAGIGDYEGIAIVAKTAYVLRADGKLFEVVNYNSGDFSVIQHNTPLTAKHDVEGLCYDKKNNRLLLAIKAKEPKNSDYKGIYAFDLNSKKLETSPVHKVNLSKGKELKPSDLDIHPLTGDIYIIDGANQKLLTMNADGIESNIHQLSSSDFSQPEGIAFSESGELFISNEGKSKPGNIIQVSMDNNL